jgi:general secretion pathway protein D
MKLYRGITEGLALALALLLSACAGERSYRDGITQLADGKTEDGLRSMAQAVKENPANLQYRTDLMRRRGEQVVQLLAAADQDRAAGRWDNGVTTYRRVLNLEPDNARASAGLEAIQRDRELAPNVEQAREALKKNDTERATTLLTPVLQSNPAHADALALRRLVVEAQTREQVAEPALRVSRGKPINLEFRDASLNIVLEALARASGVSFILDKDVRPDLRTTLYLRQASLEEAIELILQTNRLEKKVLNPTTILVYPNTPDKLKDYQELVVKGFYLANADVKQTQAMIKGLLKAKDIYVDEKLNLLVMRDTPEAIRLAEKLIAMQDLNEPEVMLEVEVLEVQRSRLLELGMQWPNQVSLTPLTASGSSALTLGDLGNLNRDRIGVSVGSAVLNVRRQIGDVNILANPRIRARNREKAKIMIGDKVPVSTSTTTATGIISESVQYLDVGIKLDVEPNIYLQDEVAIKIGLEVSSITSEVRTPGGSLAYQIGSRSASTVLRLKDGETQVLAGLINDQDRMSANRVPGLGDIPVLGRLFGSQKDDRQKTEIVLSITPHLIRNINRPDAAASEFWSGTESALRTKPLTLRMARSAGEGGAGIGVPAGVEATPDATTDSRSILPVDAAPTMMVLSWQSPAEVKLGEQFKVALRMKTDGGLRSLPLQLGFDPARFQVTEVAEGAFFKQGEAQTSLSSNIDAAAGKVFASVVRSGTDGARGDDNVVVLTLRALTAGQSDIKLLSTAPITVSDKTVPPVLPAPLSIRVVN